MTWEHQFWDCPLIRGIYLGKNPFSTMRINKSFYESFNKRPITVTMDCENNG